MVRALPRWEEARSLKEVVPFQFYDMDIGTINAYFDFLSASPSSEELSILQSDPTVIQLEVPTEVQINYPSLTLTGPVDVIGGLSQKSLLYLIGDGLNSKVKATAFEVAESPTRPAHSTMVARLNVAFVRADQQPIDTGDLQ